jgi:capsular exopolysaccharide synthesis family protein
MSKNKDQNESLDIITDFSSISAEEIQKLETNISLASLNSPLKVVAITSSTQAEGKSTLSVNMANVYARRGAKVCLVNLDLRRPSIHLFYNVKNSIGIEEYVAGEATLPQIIVHLPNGVDLINAGSYTPFPTNVISSSKLDTLFKNLRAKYDFVIVDTAPVLLVADSFLVNRLVDGFIFVVAQNKSKKKNIASAIRSMNDNNINIIGTTMTEITDFKDTGTVPNDTYRYYRSEK